MNPLRFLTEKTEPFAEAGESYIKSTQKYVKLKAFQQISILTSMLLKGFIFGTLLFIALFFIAVAGVIALGNELGSMVLGSLCVAGICILLAVIVYAFRLKINNKVVQVLSSKFYPITDEESYEETKA